MGERMTTADLRLGRWQDTLADVECDALITDPPYSARTHEGHDDGSARAPGFKRSTQGGDGWEEKWAANGGQRRSIDYTMWTSQDVLDFVAHFSPRTRGWFCAMTSHDLVPVYTAALEWHDRYVFAPLPLYSPGSRVRLAGDGPSSWTCYLVVSRPRRKPYSKWGTLPGGYVYPPEPMPVVGGKPVGLMRAIIRDYSRPGDVICDPCAGGGTTLIAALIEGRSAIGSEMDPKTHALATARIKQGHTPDMFSNTEGVTS
jgi:site-specific DNA-methyltransferase (adenine-specific)